MEAARESLSTFDLLGEPLKTFVFGNKTILKYQDITIELEDNKVVEVKAN